MELVDAFVGIFMRCPIFQDAESGIPNSKSS